MSDITPINALKIQYCKTHTLVGEYGYQSMQGKLFKRNGASVSKSPRDAERREDAENMSYPYVAIEECLGVVVIGHGDTQLKAIEDAERQLKDKLNNNSNERTKKRYKDLLMYMTNQENFYAKRCTEKGTPTA